MTTATLTDRRVAGAKPGARRYVLKDTRVTGLELRISPRAGKSWSLVYRRAGDGRRRRATIGPYPRHSLADARQIGRELLARIGRGEDPAGAKQEAKRAATFAQLATAYIEGHARRKKRSWRDDLAMMNRDLLPILGRMKVDTIAKRDVIRAVEIVAQRGALIRANRTLTLARTIFNWGLAEDLVQVNPTLGIRKRGQERPRDRVLDDGEIRAFWVGVSTVPLMTGATRDILRLALLTGQRIGEVTGMTTSEIDAAEQVWTIPADRTKNGRAHRVPLSPMAFAIVEKRIQTKPDAGALFRGPSGEPMAGAAPSKAFCRTRAMMGFADVRVHDLRRTVATRMAALGIDRVVVGKVLNHATVDRGTITGMVYDRYSYDAEKREALERWANRLADLIARRHMQAA